MNARALLIDLKDRGIRVMSCGERLLVDAPRGALTDDLRAVIARHKPEILSTLAEDTNAQMKAPSTLAEYASSVLPIVRLTIVETSDTERDFAVLHRVRRVVEEHQPGGNRVLLRILTTAGRRVRVEWRAVASRELRMGIARVLSKARARSDEQTL